MTLGGVPIGQKPEGRPRANGVRADEAAFEVAGQGSLDATPIVLQGRDQPGAVSLFTGPDSKIRFNLREGIPRRIVTGERKRAEVTTPGLVIVIGRLRIGARNGERTAKVIGKDQRHAFRCRGRILWDSFVPGNTTFIVELQIAIVFYGAALSGDSDRD